MAEAHKVDGSRIVGNFCGEEVRLAHQEGEGPSVPERRRSPIRRAHPQWGSYHRGSRPSGDARCSRPGRAFESLRGQVCFQVLEIGRPVSKFKSLLALVLVGNRQFMNKNNYDITGQGAMRKGGHSGGSRGFLLLFREWGLLLRCLGAVALPCALHILPMAGSEFPSRAG